MKSTLNDNPCARAEDRDGEVYSEHSRRLHSAARAAHKEWLATLSPEEKAKVKALNLHRPPSDESEVGGHSLYSSSDIADSPLASIAATPEAMDAPHEIFAEDFGVTPRQANAILKWHQQQTNEAIKRREADFLQLIVGGLLSSKNPKLNSAGLAFAAGLAALNGLPCQREFARQNHVSASAISKVVKSWQRTLNLRPSSHQKSEAACQTYSAVGKQRHWRNQPFKADSATSLLNRMKSISN